MEASGSGCSRPRPRALRTAALGSALLLGTAAALVSCAVRGREPSARDAAYPFPEAETYAPAVPSKLQATVVAGGLSLVGKTELVVNGIRYPMDCTGVVRAAYAFGGVDLAYRFAFYPGNGVARLYGTLRDAGLLYSTRYPAPGDLVFWDDTYDANGNGRADDPLTHVGMVVGVDAEGTVSYLHHNYRRGPVVERMNLIHPGAETLFVKGVYVTVNSPLRMRGSPPGPGTTAGELFRVFGAAYKLAR
ncbi:MAG: CHAP domain-containing protein [Treponema sp.]|nr:CHAP domain-containing protein [Treponema sp.]